MKFSIDTINYLDAVDMPLTHPVTFEPLEMADGTPMSIRLTGEHSGAYKRLQRAFQNETLKSHGKKPLTAEQLEERGLQLLAACTLGWNLQGEDGPLPFSQANAVALYRDKPWIRDAVNEFVFNKANFLGESLAA